MSIDVDIQKTLGSNFTLDVCFRSKGNCLGILGASGCGKSMALKCIAGVETPDKGRIIINGKVFFDSSKKINIRPQKRGAGYLFQNYALFPRMTVEQNIQIGIVGNDKSDKVLAALKRFQLEGLQNNYPDQLSGGQQQRVAMARMLAADPVFILLDEPFSALDSHLREYMQIEMKEILSGFNDSILVTHSRDESFKLCDELMILKDGKVLEMGETRTIFKDPKIKHAAKITGCKNFSRIERVGERELWARDWGIKLVTEMKIHERIRYVGIRAHDLIPETDSSKELPNVMHVKVHSKIEDPFEWNVLFSNCQMSEAGKENKIWWKFSIYGNPSIPDRLRFPPEALLLLE